MKKAIATIFMLSLLATLFVGCGDKEKGSQTTAGTVDSTVQTEADDVEESSGEIETENTKVWVPTKVIYEDTSLSLKHIMQFEYDEKGEITKSTTLNEDGTIASYQQYEYDENGKKKKVVNNNADGTVSSEKLYDTNGNVIKETDFEDNGLVESYTETEYDASGNKIKRTSYKSDGSVIFCSQYEYDEKGNMTKHDYIGPDSSTVSYTYVYEFDTNGNVKKEERYDATEEYHMSTTWYEYSADGFLEKKTVFKLMPDGTDGGQERTKYDKNGNKTQYTSEDGNDRIIIDDHYSYEYDDNNNMISQIVKNKSGEMKESYQYEYEEIQIQKR